MSFVSGISVMYIIYKLQKTFVKTIIFSIRFLNIVRHVTWQILAD